MGAGATGGEDEWSELLSLEEACSSRPLRLADGSTGSCGGGMGGGYGGSQYGYGGLNPGGVMQAYDPLAQLQGMGTWFKDNFGSGGATTAAINAT